MRRLLEIFGEQILQGLPRIGGFPCGDLFNMLAQSLPKAYGMIGDLCFVGVIAFNDLLDPMKRFLRGAGSFILCH
jgi:hypothetical protein